MLGSHTPNVPLPPSPYTPSLFSPWGSQLGETSLSEEKAGVTEALPQPKLLGCILPLAPASLLLFHDGF